MDSRAGCQRKGTIAMWPPKDDIVLQFVRYDSNGTQELIGTE